MSVLTFIKSDGTQTSKFQLAAAAGGVVLKNNSGNLSARNAADNADATVTGSQFLASGNSGLVINSDSAGSGADWKFTLSRPTSGMTADTAWVVPIDDGTNGFVLSTDGAGNLSWIASASGATDITDVTSLAFGDGASVSCFTLPANAIIMTITCVVDTAFDGTPSASVGIGANNSKYMGSGDLLLTQAAGWSVDPNIAPVGSTEAISIYYSAGSATVGSARFLITYSIPI